MSGEIEATPELREQYARETTENLARLGLTSTLKYLITVIGYN